MFIFRQAMKVMQTLKLKKIDSFIRCFSIITYHLILKANLRGNYVSQARDKLKQIDSFLGMHPWFTGDNVSIVIVVCRMSRDNRDV